MGISLVSCIRFSHPTLPAPWKDIVFGYREMSGPELGEYGRLSGSHESGTEFLTFTAEPVRFLPHLIAEFESGGGRIVRRKIARVSKLASFDVVVNSCGLGAGQLVSDELVQPMRGQVMRVRAPWLRTAILDDKDDGNYVIPNIGSVVLGGTHQHDWDTVSGAF